MTSARKSLQVSMRMLIRGPADRAGVLLRQRCTSKLRRWTSRPQSQIFEEDERSQPAEVAGTENACSADGRLSGVREDDLVSRMSEGVAATENASVGRFRPSGFLYEGVARSDFVRISGSKLGFSGEASGHGMPTEGKTSYRMQGLRGFSADLHRKEGALVQAQFSPGRRLLSTSGSAVGGQKGDEEKESISVTFVDRDQTERTIRVPVGTNMLQAAHDNDIDLEGACEGSLACSTCHVIFEDEAMYETLPEPTEEENDMLDLAFGLTATSRLGCQVVASKALDGIRLRIPAATRNFAVDGYVPKPH